MPNAAKCTPLQFRKRAERGTNDGNEHGREHRDGQAAQRPCPFHRQRHGVHKHVDQSEDCGDHRSDSMT